MIYLHIKHKLILQWGLNNLKDIEEFYKVIPFNNFKSLKNELDIREGITVILIDVEDINFSLITNEYLTNNPNIKFIGIGIKKDTDEVIALIKNNIFSYVSIDSDILDFLKSIKFAKIGRPYLSEYTKDELIKKYIKEIQISVKQKYATISDKIINSNEIVALSPKERTVIKLIVKGMTYKEIANLLGVTTFSINQNTKSIYRKLKVRSRSELSFKILG